MPSLYANSWNEKGNAWSRLANVLKLLHFFSQPQSLILEFCVIIAFFFLCLVGEKKEKRHLMHRQLLNHTFLPFYGNLKCFASGEIAFFFFLLRLKTKKGDRNGWNLLSSKTEIVLFWVLVYFVLNLTGFFVSKSFDRFESHVSVACSFATM